MFCSFDYVTEIQDSIAAVSSTYPSIAYTIQENTPVGLYFHLGLYQHIYALIQRVPQLSGSNPQWLGNPVRDEVYIYQEWQI